jgi:hypothetical protein
MKQIKLKFLGKDSVPYENIIDVPDEIYDILKKQKESNDTSDQLFPHATAGSVKNYLNKIHPGITPKFCRTVVCNEVLIRELKKKNITKNNTEVEKIRAIFEANLEIAKTLNHQKNISKNQKDGENKIKEKIANAKERIKNLKETQKIKLAKLNEKAEKYKTAFKGQKLLKEKLAEIDEAKAKLVKQLEKSKLSIERAEFNLGKKVQTKDIALGTSLASYADAKVLYSYLKYIDLPIGKIYTPALQKSFQWAEDVDEKYWISYPS